MKRQEEDDVVEVSELYSTALPWPTPWTVEGVVEALEPLTLSSRQQRMREVIAQRLSSVTVVMDEPHDPHNGAAIVRSAEAFGVQQIHVVPQAEDSFFVSTGVARGTERWVDVIVHESPLEAIASLRDSGFTLVATHPEGDLLPEDLVHIPKLALVLGNEHEGIGEVLLEAAERSVRVPMRGFVESLNVSVSAAVLLAAATRDRTGDLPADDQRRLYARGLFRSVHRAGEILANLQPR
ncbi:MAG: RNA methyltransferase [Myxococcales bacterium]|nr:RNA methyltransferase [Myxococcales bacterium]